MMNKFLTGVAAITLLFAANAASAEEMQGDLKEINAAAQTVTLQSGQTFKLAEGVEIEGLKAGDEVKVSYEESDDGAKIATQIQPVRASE